MSNSLWQQAVKDGHELGNHTQSHLQTASASDIDAATAYIKQHFGVTPYTMAAPYGDASYVPLAKTRFMTNRGVANSLVLPLDNTDPWNLPCFIPATGALAAAFNSQIDSALSGGAWRIVLVHGFTGGTDGAYQPVSIDEFTSGVNYAKGLGGLWIDSMVNVGAYWIGQKTVAAVTPTTSGTDKVYTWKLPTNFPPNKCLRVTVGGGTLKQNAAALPWNDRGYYEIALAVIRGACLGNDFSRHHLRPARIRATSRPTDRHPGCAGSRTPHSGCREAGRFSPPQAGAALAPRRAARPAQWVTPWPAGVQ
jgi:hypothetical protein